MLNLGIVDIPVFAKGGREKEGDWSRRHFQPVLISLIFRIRSNSALVIDLLRMSTHP
jgi:hypothetical protein